MKKIIYILIGSLVFGSFTIEAQESDISFSIKLNQEYKPDSIYVLLYPVTDKLQGVAFPKPLIYLTLTELSSSFKINPGTYYFGVMALGYKTLMLPLIIPYERDDYQMNITLNPQIIGWGGITNISDIDKVTIRGDYNLFKENNEIPMVKHDDVWKLDKKALLLENGRRYAFYVNGQETVDLLNSKVNPAIPWLTLKNVYIQNELVFDPKLYSLVYKESELDVPWREIQNQYTKIVTEVTQSGNELHGVLNRGSGISRETMKSLFQTTLTNLIEFKNQNSPYFGQFFLVEQLKLLMQKILWLSPGEPINIKKLTPLDQAFYKSEEFKNLLMEINEILNHLDPVSVFQGGFDIMGISVLANFDNFISAFPDMASEMGLEKNHFLNFIKDYTGKMKNEGLAVPILFDNITLTGFYLAYNIYGEEERIQALKLIEHLKSNYPYEKYIPAEDFNSIIELFKPKP